MRLLLIMQRKLQNIFKIFLNEGNKIKNNLSNILYKKINKNFIKKEKKI